MGSPYNTVDATPDPKSDPRWIEIKQQKRREYLFLSPRIKKGTKVPVITGGDFEFKEEEYEITVRVWEKAVDDTMPDTYSEKRFGLKILATAPAIVINRVRNYSTEIKDAAFRRIANIKDPAVRAAEKEQADKDFAGMGSDDTLYTVNGVFDFKALITDDYGVTESRWWLVKRDTFVDTSFNTPWWNTPTVRDRKCYFRGGKRNNRDCSARGPGGSVHRHYR